jgi:type III restriction enzyme
MTRALLDHWHAEDRFRRLFFCQIEALETLIFITEVAKQTKYGQDWIEKYLREKAEEAGTDLFRVACKMATGSGKTVVMSMLVAWQVLNKRRYPHDKRFTDCFLVVAPGITIRDRLRVLLPSDPNNYYRELDIVPTEYRGDLGTAKIVVTNFHAFKQREKGYAGGLTKRVLTANTPGAFTESPDEMVNRVCNDLGKHREIMVINDEAHHCYRGKPAEAKEKMTREEASEAKDRAEEARLWITGLEAVHKKIGVKAVFDLSATPFYLKGSGYPEGTLFPWVVSDFSLMDAIECGIVKIPRVPIADNAMTGDYPKYRNLWVDIREGLKDVRRGPEDAHTPPLLPGLLEGALKSLYGHYAQKFAEWEADEESRANGSTPPVFIVVCNNTNVSKAVFDYVAGYETEHQHPDGEPKVAPGALALFSNEKGQRWLHQPNTILVDSRQLESGESRSDDFKKFAAHQIEDFKAEYRKRFPGRDTENLTDEDLMREVLNTVGKKGKLGEHVRCVVSVSMLTEGWDCNTVTHILGVRAFGTRLLCEQVKSQRITFVRLDTFPGELIHAEGETDTGAAVRVCVGPEFGTLGDADISKAALEAMQGSKCDLLLVCAFAFEAGVHEKTAALTKEIKYGKLTSPLSPCCTSVSPLPDTEATVPLTSSQQPKLLDRVRIACQIRHYSPRTEDAYAAWTERFIRFHKIRHPSTMAEPEVNAFLTHLAVDGNVAASTQNQAMAAPLSSRTWT